MKQAYVSLVTVAHPDTDPGRLPSTTGMPRRPSCRRRPACTRPSSWPSAPRPGSLRRWREWAAATTVHGPVSLVISRNPSTSYEDAMLEGLARCVGDFVLEWEADLADLTVS